MFSVVGGGVTEVSDRVLYRVPIRHNLPRQTMSYCIVMIEQKKCLQLAPSNDDNEEDILAYYSNIPIDLNKYAIVIM